ncbi:flagellar hook-length control protein FliK [Erwinia psidii]|uniref:Flagellar hook-length control protein FliK n=1 Tax=Erwinia psidii TaxID=69224 RepID=A0A3N6V2K8_9GAMM|nr:flagellar hook-length control protein FliK [Erwinia psidii]MCX8956316.1 flagellar hook-length control protein FliK [Erwinia psidii]MCX8959924.1 flagellar hook-length control protein FliK [Erwinia psidii]MCX8963470.1 flagellar hook-length control protein FliK [Erwinia psidii]RQM39315.1 flagellar hook-length control protein FliK [Erwinia psidii]
MNTLPIVVNATKVTTTTTASSGSAVTAGDATTDVSLGETTQDTGAQGFLSLLGSKLMTLAKQAKTAVPTTATDSNTTNVSDSSQSAKAKLNKLLSALNQPETTSGLLASAKLTVASKTDKTDTDISTENATATTSTLSNGDMQALQALFAMLPPTQQQVTAQVNSSTAAQSDDSIKSDKQATLASLLSGNDTASTTVDEDTVTVKGNDKSDRFSAASSLTNNTATGSAKNTPDTSQLDTAFQQVLNHVTKDSEKENLSSPASSTITSNVTSAASAALTPVTTTTVTAPATSQLSAQLGSPEWQQALSQQIVMFSRNGQQTAELHLHPQDLGSIQISLKLDNDQAQLSMVSGHSEVRAALEAALPQLRTALAESGINLGQSNVSSDAFQQGQSFSGQQEQQRNNSGGNTFSLTAENDSDVTAISVPTSLQARAGGNSAVDIFA